MSAAYYVRVFQRQLLQTLSLLDEQLDKTNYKKLTGWGHNLKKGTSEAVKLG
jgi:hypothetical protein